jgi:hypothetical protein
MADFHATCNTRVREDDEPIGCSTRPIFWGRYPQSDGIYRFKPGPREQDKAMRIAYDVACAPSRLAEEHIPPIRE